ncbi:MAG: nodulation protein NfeD [Burkholderiales bacterium RIFOXYC12_FULL_60_6]|nr:MAG: nodulation protein NfeD [Burkholderiales bacterium RIFOXYC12_FULL_60_6]
MHFHKLDLNLLVALDTLLSLQSVSRAAEQLHMSQSAMSNALGRLRDYFDDELLVQIGRKMELTQRAEVLRDAVQDVLLRIDTTITAQPKFEPAKADRVFRICVSDYSMTTVIPNMLALAHAQAGSVKFQLLPQVGQPDRALERGEADLLVVPKAFCSLNHPKDILFEETFCCVVWSGSRIASTGKLDSEDYAQAGHVAMQPISYVWSSQAVMQPTGGTAMSYEAGSMQKMGLERRVEVSTFSFVAAPSLVVGTERIATVHARLARMAERFLPVKLFPLPIALPPMEQAVQWHKYATKDPGLVWLRGLLSEAVRKMDGH